MRDAKTYRGERRRQAKQEFHAYGRKGQSWVDFWLHFETIRRRVERKAK